MPQAARKIEPKAKQPDLLPVPKPVIEINNAIDLNQDRIEKLNAAIGEADKLLSGLRTDLESLDADENTKLEELGAAEIAQQDTKPIREALDSIRGRRKMRHKAIEEIVTDQAGRRKILTRLTDEVSSGQKERDRLISQWLMDCYANMETELRSAAQEAVKQWFAHMAGLGQCNPPMHNPRWMMINLAHETNGDTFEMRGLVMRAELTERARRARK